MTAGLSSKRDKKTEIPSTMEVLQFGLDPFPIVVEPPFDGLELVIPVGIDLIEAGFAQALAFDTGAFDERAEAGGLPGAEHVDSVVELEVERFEVGDVAHEIVRVDEQEVALFETEFARRGSCAPAHRGKWCTRRHRKG